MSISIKPSLLLGVQGTIDFGQVLSSSAATETVTPDNGARFQVLGHNNGDVIVSFNDVALTNDLGGPDLTFEPNVVYTGASDTYVAGASHTSGNTVSMVDDNADGTGEIYLLV